jgi:hypothetical protein
MDQALMRRLKEAFSEEVQMLGDLLGRDLSAWNRP